MDTKQLQDEREKIVENFIKSMNEWVEAFNNYADKLIKNYEELPQSTTIEDDINTLKHAQNLFDEGGKELMGE